MQTTLRVTLRNVYGNRMIYPACETSRAICALLETKTLTARHVEHLKGLGYTFTITQETI